MSGFLLFAALSLSRAQTHTYTLSVGVHFPVACCIDDCTALLFDFTVSLSLFLSGGSFEKSKKKTVTSPPVLPSHFSVCTDDTESRCV